MTDGGNAMSELTFIFGKVEDFQAQGIDTEGLRTTADGMYCIKHINLISAEAYNHTKFEDGFIGLTPAQIEEVMAIAVQGEDGIDVEATSALVNAFFWVNAPVNPYEELLLQEMGV